ncbi:MAG: hypothetical protein AAGA38_11540 [Pseudomonadota bacterium]
MKKEALILLAGLAVTACGTTPDTTAATQFVGKELTAASGDKVMFNRDGTISGVLRGEPVAGTYNATGTEICSQYSSPADLVGQDFCSVPLVDEGKVTFIRRDGSQSQAYAIPS